MVTDEEVRRMLGDSWDLSVDIQVERHDGGMGSRTWIVDGDGQRLVAKAVAPHLADSFAKGLQVARKLERAGIPAGIPAATVSGKFTAGGWRPALLTWAPGVPLTGADEREMRLIGRSAVIRAGIAVSSTGVLPRTGRCCTRWRPPSCTWAASAVRSR